MEGWERFPSSPGMSAKPFLTDDLMLQPQERRPSRFRACKECCGVFVVCSCRRSYFMLKICIFSTAACSLMLRERSWAKGGMMPQGLWQAEQMHNFMLKKSPPYTSCLLYPSHHYWWHFSFWKVSLPCRKSNLSSLFRRCFCWQSQRSSLLSIVFQALVVEHF